MRRPAAPHRPSLTQAGVTLWTTALFLAASTIGGAEDPDLSRLPPAAARPVDFAADIRPIFEAKCFSCHGPEKQKSGFRLDVKSAALAGGEHGRAIVPGRSAESPLIHFTARLVADMEMPPKGEPLSAEEIGLLRAWIDQGAIWPDGLDTPGVQDRRDHWAFKPLLSVEPPAIRRVDWPRNDVDRFILARLEADGLAPSPEADRRTLIRRLYLDLHGLPPSPEEVAAFVADPDPRAYERLVDRLLDSPRYGERWARHWLDAVHYGDSHGYDKDKPRTHAWPYRDYVIRSFNADKPYARFVEEQLAGDVLFPGDPDGVVALGFIAAGPWDYVGHVELPETKTDGLIARYNDRDDMVMTAMSTFVSLTVHCARCHDHKFDPIPQREYYALQAVFAGVDRSNRPFDRDPAVHRERQPLLREKRLLELRRAPLDAALAKARSDELTALDVRLRERRTALDTLAGAGGESPANGWHSGIESAPDVMKWVQVDLGEPRALDEIRLIPARPTDFTDTPGFGFPVRFRVEAADTEDFATAHVVADHTAADFVNPGDEPVLLPGGGRRARFVRVTATRLWKRTGDYVFALGELQAVSGGTNAALGRPVSALDSIEAGRWGRARLVDGFDSHRRLGSPPAPELAGPAKQRLEEEIRALHDRRRELALVTLTPAQQEEWREATARLEAVRRRLDALPKPELVYAATSDFAAEGSFMPPPGPRPVHNLRRGDVKSPGDLMTPAALSCFPWLPAELEIPAGLDEGARRTALARWLTDPRNAALRRSLVNRVWHHHFGRGLVDTPNDFGWMGSPPSHPELLDWLAARFQLEGGSMKKLHRLLLTSAAWRQSSEFTGTNEGNRETDSASRSLPDTSLPSVRKNASVDSDNRLLWRMNRSRLDAESLRDAILAVSGRLDLTMGGPAVQQFAFRDDHSPVYDYVQFDPDSPAGRRRSIYRFVVRSAPDPFMDTMDCPDPSILTPKRSQTLTPLQALALLNNPWVLRQAEHFAARVEAETDDPPDQVRRAVALAFQREASAEEVAQLTAYSRRHGLAGACRLLFNSNEFVFVD
ncbi:MAG: DUF1549 domain-containing protein [Limisphaerales bacterium]